MHAEAPTAFTPAKFRLEIASGGIQPRVWRNLGRTMLFLLLAACAVGAARGGRGRTTRIGIRGREGDFRKHRVFIRGTMEGLLRLRGSGRKGKENKHSKAELNAKIKKATSNTGGGKVLFPPFVRSRCWWSLRIWR